METRHDLSGIKPVAREESLSSKVYTQVKLALMSGAYKPGEKVTIRALAEAARVSFTPAREAVARLIIEGGLEYVGPKTVIVPVLTSSALVEITATRKALECMVTDLGARTLTPRSIVKMRRVQERLEAAMERADFKEVLHQNEEFHFLIYRRSGYSHAVQMIESCWVRIGPSLNWLYPEFSISKEGVNNHHMLMDAVEAGHPERAADYIRADIEGGFARLSALIG